MVQRKVNQYLLLCSFDIGDYAKNLQHPDMAKWALQQKTFSQVCYSLAAKKKKWEPKKKKLGDLFHWAEKKGRKSEKYVFSPKQLNLSSDPPFNEAARN